MTGRAARLTAPGVGGLHVFGIDGEDVEGFLAAHFRSAKGRGEAELSYGRIVDGEEFIDEAILHRRGPTRVDLSVHGSVAVEGAMTRLLTAWGFEIVPDWNEWGTTLVAHEAQAALAGAFAAQSVLFLAGVLEGRLEREIESLLRTLQGGPMPRPVGVESRIATLLDRAHLGVALVEPPTVLLTGPSNAGKSTLFNRLVGGVRTITSPEAGTTRDVVEVAVELGGYPFRLCDSAGRRESPEALEGMGIARSHALRSRAELVVEVVDGSLVGPEIDLDESEDRLLLVVNKVDLLDEARQRLVREWHPQSIFVSAATGEDVDALVRRVIYRTAFGGSCAREFPCPFTRRQVRLLGEAAASLPLKPERAAECLEAVLRGE